MFQLEDQFDGEQKILELWAKIQYNLITIYNLQVTIRIIHYRYEQVELESLIQPIGDSGSWTGIVNFLC